MDTNQMISNVRREMHNPANPAVVIAVGPFAQRILYEVVALRSLHQNREMASEQFYVLASDEQETLTFREVSCLEDISQILEPVESSQTSVDLEQAGEERRAAFQRAARQAKALLSALEIALHRARDHERLIAAGWEGARDVPVDVYMLADCKEPESAGVLLPLFSILRETMARDLLSQAYLLLNIAVFPSSDYASTEAQETLVLSLLREIDALMDPRSKETAGLTRLLDLPAAEMRSPAVFLFDHRKEGSVFVRDQAGIRTAMGNVLAALLSGSAASRILAGQEWAGVDEKRGRFASIGAAIAAEDPAFAQAVCAYRAAGNFLDSQMLSEPVSDTPSVEEAEQILTTIGQLPDWLAQVLMDIPSEAGRFSIQPGSAVSAGLPALSFRSIDYEKLTSLDWDVAIQAYFDRLTTVMLPQVQRTISANASRLCEERLALLLQAVTKLPRKSSLYPGGLRAADKALERLVRGLNSRRVEMDQALLAAQECQRIAVEGLQRDCDEMRALLAQVPGLPWWVNICPGFLRQKAAHVWYLWKFCQPLQQIFRLRSRMTERLEQFAASAVTQAAVEVLLHIPDLLTVEVQKSGEKLKQQTESLREARASLESGRRAAEEQHLAAGWEDFQRVCLTGAEQINWGYEKMHPDFSGWLDRLLLAEAVFSLDDADFARKTSAWLVEQGRAAFAPFWDLSLDDWAEIWQGLQAGEYDFPAFIQQRMEICRPLLRPDFDASGGGGTSQLKYFVLLGRMDWTQSPHTKMPWLLGASAERWETLWNGSPYAACYLQARINIPLSAFEYSYIQGLRKLASQSAGQEDRYVVITNGDLAAVETISSNGDGKMPVRIRYDWAFHPKGAKESIRQEIVLEINPANYQYYRQLPRFNGQWNRYAEVEIPEVRSLALEFQRLHAGRRWSTYNQVSNVLAFVQSCIQYRSDKETTGHQDWSRFPIETLVETVGDCEDVAILCAAVIARLGFQVVLLLYPRHLAFGVSGADHLKGDYVVDSSGARYYYGEATARGWRLGEIPKEYRDMQPEQILPVKILVEEDSETEEH